MAQSWHGIWMHEIYFLVYSLKVDFSPEDLLRQRMPHLSGKCVSVIFLFPPIND